MDRGLRTASQPMPEELPPGYNQLGSLDAHGKPWPAERVTCSTKQTCSTKHRCPIRHQHSAYEQTCCSEESCKERTIRGASSITRNRLYGRAGLSAFESVGKVWAEQPLQFMVDEISARVGDYRVSQFHGPVMSLTRRVTPDTVDELRFAYVLRGTGTLTQGTSTVPLSPGASVITVGWRPYRIELSSTFTMLRVQFSSGIIVKSGMTIPTGLTDIPRDFPMSRSLAGVLQATLRPEFHPATQFDVSRVARIFDSLCVGLVSNTATAQSSSMTPDDYQKAEIRKYLDRHPNLNRVSVSEVAVHFGMSVRSLQRLFENEEFTLGEELANRRWNDKYSEKFVASDPEPNQHRCRAQRCCDDAQSTAGQNHD